jgi:signal transduction histidine kinase
MSSQRAWVSRRDSAASQILLRPLLRVLNWLRVALCVHALVVNALRWHEAAHQGLLVAALIWMVTWTALAAIAYARPTSRRQEFIVADLVVAIALMGLSAPILGTSVFASDYLALPAYWAICAPLVVAMAYGVVPGAIAGGVVGGILVAVTPSVEPVLWSWVVVFGLLGAGIGVLVDLLLASVGERDRAFAETASLAERERLNRIVHDGVLQVLALMEREGPGFGPRGIRLASLAREQESRLRVLLLDRSPLGTPDANQVDITSVLDRHESSTVTISAMAEPVMVSSRAALEIDAVVTEILANVAKHAGPTARAWVLLEHEDKELIISVRDNGVGAQPDDITHAGDQGHVGVRDSVLGRVRDLGGQAAVHAAPGRGVDWELRIPVQ